ncbi:hypothetical protein M3Y99_00175000 [Aphelenchoides fujianensis]|nr:hypothetical protein M3Y99_00175000 [Aphelenchoides fujianensis]
MCARREGGTGEPVGWAVGSGGRLRNSGLSRSHAAHSVRRSASDFRSRWSADSGVGGRPALGHSRGPTTTGSRVNKPTGRHKQSPADPSESGNSPLHIAAACGRVTVCALLLELGADVNRRDENDATPLNHALSVANRQVALLLLRRRAEPTCRSRNGNSPLLSAVQFGLLDVCTALLEAGADPNVQLEDGATAALPRRPGRPPGDPSPSARNPKRTSHEAETTAWGRWRSPPSWDTRRWCGSCFAGTRSRRKEAGDRSDAAERVRNERDPPMRVDGGGARLFGHRRRCFTFRRTSERSRVKSTPSAFNTHEWKLAGSGRSK